MDNVRIVAPRKYLLESCWMIWYATRRPFSGRQAIDFKSKSQSLNVWLPHNFALKAYCMCGWMKVSLWCDIPAAIRLPVLAEPFLNYGRHRPAKISRNLV